MNRKHSIAECLARGQYSGLPLIRPPLGPVRVLISGNEIERSMKYHSAPITVGASSGLDGYIKLWDMESGKLNKSIDGGPGGRGLRSSPMYVRITGQCMCIASQLTCGRWLSLPTLASSPRAATMDASTSSAWRRERRRVLSTPGGSSSSPWPT